MPHHVPREIRYNFEYERRLKACFIGAGGHAYRNVYPTFRYAPVDLVAICDLSLHRANDFARLFGPNGIMNTFFQQKLAGMVDQTLVLTVDASRQITGQDLAVDGGWVI